MIVGSSASLKLGFRRSAPLAIIVAAVVYFMVPPFSELATRASAGVSSTGQLGGQTANSIVNNGPVYNSTVVPAAAEDSTAASARLQFRDFDKPALGGGIGVEIQDGKRSASSCGVSNNDFHIWSETNSPSSVGVLIGPGVCNNKMEIHTSGVGRGTVIADPGQTN